MTDELSSYRLRFTRKLAANVIVKRELMVRLRSLGEALARGRHIASDSRGVWQFEGAEQSQEALGAP